MGKRGSPATALLLCALLSSAAPASAKDSSTLQTARSLMKDGRYEEAFNLFEKSGGDRFDGTDGQLARIYCIMMLGHFQSAVEESSKVLDKDPKVWQVRLFRAESYEKLGKHAMAKADQKLLPDFDYQPLTKSKEYDEAQRLIHQDEHARAIPSYTAHLKKCPGDVIAYLGRAKAERGIKRFDLALLDYNQALKYGPQRSKPYLERARCLLQMKRNDEALLDYGRFIDLHPAYDTGFFERAEVYRKLGQYKNAIGDYSSILSFQHDDEEALRLRADTYTLDGQYGKAIADYTRALDTGPMESGRYYFARAQAYDKLGKHNLADADRRKAKEVGYEGQK